MSSSENICVISCWSKVWSRPKDYSTENFGNHSTFCLNIGEFCRLSPSLMHLAFDKLSALDLGRCALISHGIRSEVIAYCQSPSSSIFRTLFPHTHISIHKLSIIEEGEYIRRAKLIGLLLKRSTMLLPTRDRIERLQNLMQCFLCLPSANAELSEEPTDMCHLHRSQPTRPSDSALATVEQPGLRCPCPYSCVRPFMFGHILRTFIRGWEESELKIVFNVLCTTALGPVPVKSLIFNLVIENVPGKDSIAETRLRKFLRRVFLDPHPNQDKLFWLELLLDSSNVPAYNARIAARILFLLFGPSHELASHGGAHVLWEDVSQLTVANRDQLRHCFQDLGGILKLFEQHQTVGPFKNLVFADQFAYFLMQLFRTPNEWLLENIACQLLLAGERVIQRYIVQLAKEHRAFELGNLVAAISLIYVKLDLPFSDIIIIIKFIEEELEGSCHCRQQQLLNGNPNALGVLHPQNSRGGCTLVARFQREIAVAFRSTLGDLLQQPNHQPSNQELAAPHEEGPSEPDITLVLRAQESLLVVLFTELHTQTHNAITPSVLHPAPTAIASAPSSVIRSLNSPRSSSNDSESQTTNSTTIGRTRSLSMNISEPEPDEPVPRRARLSLSDSLDDLSLHHADLPMDIQSPPIEVLLKEDSLSEDQLLPSNTSSSQPLLGVEGQGSDGISVPDHQQHPHGSSTTSENNNSKPSETTSASGMDLLDFDPSPHSPDSDMALEDGSVPN